MDRGEGGKVSVQISPDGILWADEGTTIAMPGDQQVAFGRVAAFRQLDPHQGGNAGLASSGA